MKIGEKYQIPDGYSGLMMSLTPFEILTENRPIFSDDYLRALAVYVLDTHKKIEELHKLIITGDPEGHKKEGEKE